MSANDSTMEKELLVIAKDLLQASDDLAATDPSASATFAQEAYEIGRNLGVVLDRLEEKEEPAFASALEFAASDDHTETEAFQLAEADEAPRRYERTRRSVMEESDDDLYRILDRQKEVLPTRDDFVPNRSPGRAAARSPSLTFESAPKRTGWLSWVRPREWRHAG